MSAVGPIEFPDLDFLINAAEESSGEGNSSDKGAFDPDEYAGFVQWYSEQSTNLQQHYETHLEHQKQKLAEENEAGLLEALQQSLENFESDHMSDFASLSTLDNACSYPTPNSASVVESSSDGFEKLNSPSVAESSSSEFEKQSVLKEILLNPLSENYAKEIDSPEHILGTTSTENSSSDHNAIIKPRVSKIMKPFAELLKHMEASESTTEKNITSIAQRPKQNGTRFVNTQRYMSKYASATNNKKEPPSDKVQGLGKRIILHSMKNGTQNSKTLTLSLKPNSTARFINPKPLTTGGNIISTGGFTNSKNVPIFSTSPTALKTVTITSPKLAEKRAATTPSEELAQKKRCLCPSGTAGLCIDHDYCAIQSNGNSRDETAADERPKELELFTTPECPKSPAKAMNAQKVLKLEDYLQQVRAGVRSAPNSPTTSPKVARGSARPSNNFMNVSLQGHQIPPKSLVNTTAGSGKINGKMPIPEALRKKTIKQKFGLQEFDRYISVLQNNLSSSSKNSEADTPVEAVSVSPAISAAKVEPSTSTTFSAAHSLVAMVQQQQSEVLQKTEKAASDSKQQASKSQNILKNECTVVKKQLKLVSIPTRTRTSGQRLMIKIPVSSATTRKSSTRKSNPPTPAVSPSDPLPKTVVVTQGPTISTSVPSQAQVSPTFKLMTSNKDGAEAKSLILSGVTGKLKDILTHMAEQQAKAKSQNGGKQPEQPVSSENQLNTLQKLIACLSSQQNLKLDPVSTSNPLQTGVAKEITVDSYKETTVAESSSAGPTTSLLHTSEKSQSPVKKTTSLPNFEETLCSKITSANLEQEPKTIPPTQNGKNIVDGNAKCSSGEEETKCISNVDGGASVVKIAPAKDEILQSNVVQSKVVLQTRLAEVKQPTSKPEHLGPVGGSTSQPVAITSASLKDTSENQKLNSVTVDSSPKFSMTSMAAAEMLASNVIDDGTEEIMVYSKPEVKSESVDENNNEVESVNGDDPVVITLEEAVARLEDDEILSQDNSRTTSLSTADNLFCKLPSYFLTEKIKSAGKPEEISGKPEESMEGLMMRGMKNVFCDPLVSSEANDVEINKLPHYPSSEKLSRPNSPLQVVQKSCSTMNVGQNNDFAVELNRVCDTQHLTQQETPVNTTETYYSKLPTYYSNGRPYPPVKTFNDEVADAKDDDTVTSEMLDVDKHEKHRRRSKRRHRKKKKKKHKRAKREKSSEKVLYSKLPSCYLSGRVLGSHKKDKTRRISRSRSVRSPAPRSLSYSSRSSRSRSRSPLRRSRSRRRRSSRNFSRSLSRSSSGSEGESRRSWRRERRSSRYRKERSYDRRSYDSSDEDHDEYIWRREREARQARRQHEDTVEKERERAMEERRVVYVGRINRQTTKQELRNKFLRFGDIEAVSLHFRDDGDNYGFLTFQYTSDAFHAIEEGRNLGPDEPRYELCFGGRRQFCKSSYQDLDSKVAEPVAKANDLNDFDALLQQARRSIRR